MKILILFELAAIVAVPLLALMLGRRRMAPLAAVARFGARLGRSPRLSTLLVGLLGFAISAALRSSIQRRRKFTMSSVICWRQTPSPTGV